MKVVFVYNVQAICLHDLNYLPYSQDSTQIKGSPFYFLWENIAVRYYHDREGCIKSEFKTFSIIIVQLVETLHYIILRFEL